MEFESVNEIERATRKGRTEMFRLGTALLFVVGVMLYSGMSVGQIPNGYMLVVAAMIGGYMAINIGANDVANNVGPAVGSKAITLTGAIIIAGIFEASGALIAGGDVVSTIKKGIIDPAMISNTDAFVWLMLAALLAAAIWLNIATAIGAPVSTTHSIVGGVFGVGFLREYLKTTYTKMVIDIQHHYHGEEEHKVEEFLKEFKIASIDEKASMLKELKARTGKTQLTKKERRRLQGVYRHELVKRTHLLRIIAAWLVTVPLSGLMAALLYFTIRGMMLP